VLGCRAVRPAPELEHRPRGHVIATTARRRRPRWRDVRGFFYVLPWLIGFALFQLFPFVASFAISFTKWDFGGDPVFVGLGNYRALLEDKLLRKSLANTVYYTVLHVPGSIAIAFSLALLLNQRARFVTVYRTLFYLPSVTTGVATAIIWIWLLQPDGLVNRGLGLVGVQGPAWLASTTWSLPALVLMSFWSVGGSMVIFLAGLQGVPESLFEAVSIDGGGEWAKFRHVTVPLMTPYIFLSAVLGVIGSFQVFTQALVMTSGGPADATTFVVLVMYWAGWQWWQMGYATAIAWMLLVIILLFTAIQFRVARSWVYYEYDRPEGRGG
jgi:multiple sugar transport system permease protein